MSVSTSASCGDATGPAPRGSRVLLTALTISACTVQAFVLLFTFVMGLGWSGRTYDAALVQAVLAFVLIAGYEAELTRLGWRLTPGRHEATVGTAAEKGGMSMVVDMNRGEEGGAETLEVVNEAGATPCAMNTVDEFLKRTPTTVVEPGNWSMLVGTEDDPAPVLIRTSTAAVVFTQEARRRPGACDDELRTEGHPASVETLPLKEGDYQVGCRPKDAAVTTLPLRGAWAAQRQGSRSKTSSFVSSRHRGAGSDGPVGRASRVPQVGPPAVHARGGRSLRHSTGCSGRFRAET